MEFPAAAALPPYHSSHGVVKKMDPCGDSIYTALAAGYSELSSAMGESGRYQGASDLVSRVHTHTSAEIQECMDTGVRKLSEEGIHVSPTSPTSHRRNNSLHCS